MRRMPSNRYMARAIGLAEMQNVEREAWTNEALGDANRAATAEPRYPPA